LHTLVIGRLCSGKIKCAIGYRKIWEPKIKEIVFVYGGVLGALGEDEFDLLLQHFRRTLASGAADVVTFNHLPNESRLYSYLQRKVKGLEKGRPWLPNIHWDMEVPRNVDEFYGKLSTKHRHEIKRQFRRLTENLKGKWDIKSYEHESDVTILCKDAAAVSRKTYQHAMGIGFVNDVRHQRLFTSRAGLGQLKAHVLYCKDMPAAFQIGMQYRNTLHLNYIGYDPQWKRFSVGTLLFVKVLEDLCTSNSVQQIDFGFGDADYKKSYCTRSWPEVTVYLFSRRFRPQIINTVRGLCSRLSAFGQFAARRTGFLSKIKTRWRQRIRKKGNAAGLRK
jgi:hypothetical protein